MEILQTSSGRRWSDKSRLGNSTGSGGDGLLKSGRSSLVSAALRRRKIDVESDLELVEAYPDNLNFYTSPPTYSISLQEFEQYSVERLKMLRSIERFNLNSEIRYSNEYFYKLSTSIKQNELPTYYTLFSAKADMEEQFMARKIDHISHFLLRLAFSRTDEQRKWFMSLEVDFFRLKLWYINSIAPVLKKYDLPFVEVTDKEKEEFHQEIIDASFTGPTKLNEQFQVFKVHFTHALDLVRNRRVFLHMGYAYVPYTDLAGVISLKFRSYLSESLSILKKNLHLVEDDERLRPLVTGFEKRHLGSDSSVVKRGDIVTMAELSTFAHKSFPLCMKHLYDVVQKEHHLKHWGRLQLGLFFKGLGLQLDEATKFWRNNFTKRPEIDASRFDKQYLYNIRHMYGQEGKRADYTPYSCMKVINSSVGPGDHQGCPFRHSDATPLRVKFVDAGIPQEGIKEIMNLVELKHYQIACQRYFEWTHDKLTVDGGVNHPNQYFMESRNILTGKKTVKSEGTDKVETTRTLYYKNGQSQIITPSQAAESMNTPADSEGVSSSAGNVDFMDEESTDEIFAAMEY